MIYADQDSKKAVRSLSLEFGVEFDNMVILIQT